MSRYDDDVLDSYRPALRKLKNDIEGLQSEFLDGFSSRREIVMWLQKTGTHTLGELPSHVIESMSRQFRQDRQGTALAAMLTPEQRDKDIDEDVAEAFRHRLVSEELHHAYLRAFLRLRERATEYVDAADDGDNHDPNRQRFVAMRPSLDELHSKQRDVLRQFLDGFDSREDVLDWSNEVPLATHGEIDEDVLTQMLQEDGVRQVLTGSEPRHERTRELLAVTYLLPAFLDGVRDMTGRASELPDAEQQDSHIAQA